MTWQAINKDQFAPFSDEDEVNMKVKEEYMCVRERKWFFVFVWCIKVKEKQRRHHPDTQINAHFLSFSYRCMRSSWE